MQVDDWPALLAEPGACLHLYGKAESRPGRKMGHVTRVFPERRDGRSAGQTGRILLIASPSPSLIRVAVAIVVSKIPAITPPQEVRVQVLVRDNNVDQALKALKKKMQREGIFREMKLRGHYEKPSEKRAREKAEAVRRARKLARKKMQREGLLPTKPKATFGRARFRRLRAPALKGGRATAPLIFRHFSRAWVRGTFSMRLRRAPAAGERASQHEDDASGRAVLGRRSGSWRAARPSRSRRAPDAGLADRPRATRSPRSTPNVGRSRATSPRSAR